MSKSEARIIVIILIVAIYLAVVWVKNGMVRAPNNATPEQRELMRAEQRQMERNQNPYR